jgi:uncharacterized membrane protein
MKLGTMIGGALVASMCGTAVAAPAADVNTIDAIGRLLGRMHPLVIHFPIALIIVACGVEVWHAARGERRPAPMGVACVALGAAGAAVAAGMGWLNAAYERPGSASSVLFLHRWIGIAVAVASAGLAVLSVRASRAEAGIVRSLYRAGLVVTAVLVSVGAHLGGMMTYGDLYLTDAVAALWGGGPAGGGPPMIETARPMVPLSAVHFPETGPVDFRSHVEPIFAAACWSCHSAAKSKGRLRLDSKAAAMAGGRSGPVVIAGHSGESLLIQRVMGSGDDDQMPLDAPPLEDEKIRILRAWIDQGAAWPDEAPPEAGPKQGAGPTSAAPPAAS